MVRLSARPQVAHERATGLWPAVRDDLSAFLNTCSRQNRGGCLGGASGGSAGWEIMFFGGEGEREGCGRLGRADVPTAGALGRQLVSF